MWWLCCVILFGVLIWQSWAAGPKRALGVVVVLSLLAPTWVMLQLADLPIHLRAAAGVLGLVAYCVHPQARINWRLGLIDLLGIGLLFVHVVSDWSNDGWDWSVPFRAYGEWAIPFLAGRLAIQSIDDARGLLPWVLAVSMLLAGLAVTESLTHTNLVETVFGERPIDQFPRNATRLGLKRAFGPTMHPIYFGTLQVLLFSWTMYGAYRSWHDRGRWWWRWSPMVAAAGVLFTISRAPLLALGSTLYVAAVLARPRYRKALALLLIVAIVGGAVSWRGVLDLVHWLGGELRHVKRNQPTVVIDNEQRLISSVMTRVYFFDVYGLAMRRAGLLGYGTERTTGFPPRVPVARQHADTLKRIWTIDNTFILLVLRFGYAGCFLFLAMSLAAIGKLAYHSWHPVRGGTFLAVSAGALVSGLLILLTVWMPHDYGFWLLWSVGAASGLDLSGRSEPPERDSSVDGNISDQ